MTDSQLEREYLALHNSPRVEAIDEFNASLALENEKVSAAQTQAQEVRHRIYLKKVGIIRHPRPFTVAEQLGLTWSEVREIRERLVRQQDGKCAICQRDFDGSVRPALDHNHLTGAVRQVICLTCNSALGMARDNPDLLRRGANYLEQHDGKMDS